MSDWSIFILGCIITGIAFSAVFTLFGVAIYSSVTPKKDADDSLGGEAMLQKPNG